MLKVDDYLVLKLSEEAVEVLEAILQYERNPSPVNRQSLVKEWNDLLSILRLYNLNVANVFRTYQAVCRYTPTIEWDAKGEAWKEVIQQSLTKLANHCSKTVLFGRNLVIPGTNPSITNQSLIVVTTEDLIANFDHYYGQVLRVDGKNFDLYDQDLIREHCRKVCHYSQILVESGRLETVARF